MFFRNWIEDNERNIAIKTKLGWKKMRKVYIHRHTSSLYIGNLIIQYLLSVIYTHNPMKCFMLLERKQQFQLIDKVCDLSANLLPSYTKPFLSLVGSCVFAVFWQAMGNVPAPMLRLQWLGREREGGAGGGWSVQLEPSFYTTASL